MLAYVRARRYTTKMHINVPSNDFGLRFKRKLRESMHNMSFSLFFFCFCVFLFNSIKHFFFAVRCFPLCSKHFSAFFNIPFSCWCILEYKHHTPHIHSGPGVLLSGVERGEVNWKCYSQTLPNTHISICTLKSH